MLGRARKGVLWVSVVVYGSKVLNVATTLILARILAPEDYGLLAAASVVVAALVVFTDMGLGTAIVQSKADRQRMASTAFFLMPAIGLLLYLVAFASAGTLADLLNSPRSENLIRVVSLSLLLGSFATVPAALLEKDMAYKRKAIPDLVPTFVYIAVTLVLATAFDAGPYSLAIGSVSSTVAAVVLVWAVSSWRPSWCFDWAIAKQLVSFGKHVLGGGVIIYVTTNMDNIFVSRVEGPAALGLYGLAYSLANLPATHIADVIGRVLLPSFVQMNDDLARLRRNYVRSLKLITLVVSPVVAGLAATSPVLVPVLLGPKWEPMVPALALLLVFGGIRSVAGSTGSLLLAVGRPGVIFVTGLTGLALQAIALPVFLLVLDMGVTGAGLAVALASLVNSALIMAVVQRMLHFSGRRTLALGTRRLLPAALMGGVVWGVGTALPVALPTLLLQVVLGAALYVGFLVLINGRAPIDEARALTGR
nr:lipopolysaccharide biosynthesis protein [Motilibacter deserti]